MSNPIHSIGQLRAALTEGPLQSVSTARVLFPLRRGRMTDNGATPWVATLGLGSPPQELRFMLDTGTTNTWVTDASCTTDACKAHRAFDPSASTTFHQVSATRKPVSFGPWGTMTVTIGADLCHLDREVDGTASQVALDEAMTIYLAVDYQGQQFAELDCDGGLAIPAVPCEVPSSLLEQLKRQGLISHAVAAFWFDRPSGVGECAMGAVDRSRFAPGSLNVLEVEPLAGELAYLWNVRLDQLQCGSTTVAQGTSLVLDTGSSRFKGGKAITDRMLAAIADHGRLPTTVTKASDLANYPDIELVLGGVAYTLAPAQYFLRIGPDLWEVGVRYLDGLDDELLVVGSVFLDSLYSVFYYQTGVPGLRAVGLAEPRPCAQQAADLSGDWNNEFGSTLTIGAIDHLGRFTGSYRSSTGASGVYPVVGLVDPEPVGPSIALSFSVGWRSMTGPSDPSWHWVSGFTGLAEQKDGETVLTTQYLLQQNATKDTPDWMATAIYPSNFRRAP